MRSYQIEYIANIKEAASLAEAKRPEGASSEDYAARRLRDQKRMEELAERNMFLLRRELFPLLDHLSVAEPETLEELREFAGQLLTGRGKQDIGLFCQIHCALLSLARQQKDRAGTIRELYWMGIGRNSQCNMLIGLDISIIELYSSAMRLYFTEAAAYLKYYDSLEDSETRGYVLRSRANMALGQFKYPSEKINLLRKTLRIMQDKGYREKAPELPWDRYLSMTQEMMAASVSYGKEKVMTPEDISTLMESVYLVYQKRIQEAELENQKPSVRWSFPYYAMEYYCGIYGLGTLLSRMEALMDRADPSDLSAEGLYGIISLPAFYCQYLNQNPELIPERRTYLERLYRRLLRYVDAFPAGQVNETLFRYLRQLSHTYVETEGSVPYGEFIQKLLLRFAPEVYVHSWIVAEGAKFLCGFILEEESAFFDDIEEIASITDLEQKRRAVLDLAQDCGRFCDIGRINFIDLFNYTPRQWFEEEYELARLHTIAGKTLLFERPSTRRCAPAALGHHSWYDGSRGYPSDYKRLECPERQMVDVIGLIDWLVSVTDADHLHTGEQMTFDGAIEAAIALEGRRFSPMLTARLRDGAVVEPLRRILKEGRRLACCRIYEESRSQGEKS